MGRQITTHFNEDELACACCGRMEFSDTAVERLEALRVAVGFPLRVNSGYRCPDYNARVSKSGRTGPHTVTENDSIAVDLDVNRGEAFEVISAARVHGFTGLGVRQKGSSRFVHLDAIAPGGRKFRPTVWSY